MLVLSHMMAWNVSDNGVHAGALVGPYRVGEPIGTGGMGVVFEAERASGERVAIKVLRRKWLADPATVQHFHEEALAGSLVRHDNVAAVVDYGHTEDGVPFLVMERVRGESLALMVKRDGPLPLRLAADIVSQVLAGLDAMHRLDIVHGDVKSGNVLVDSLPDGTSLAKLIDLGLAQVHRVPLQGSVGPRVVAGTPEFMAPEVIAGRGVFPASDLYSVGVILYETMTGTTPFAGGTRTEVLRRHLEDEVVPPSLPSPDRAILPALEQVVLRALEKDRRDRFPNAKVFATALARAVRSLEGDKPCVRRFSRRSLEAPTVRWVRHDERGGDGEPASRPRERWHGAAWETYRDYPDEVAQESGRPPCEA